jgi:predicted nucleic acid-binding protein
VNCIDSSILVAAIVQSEPEHDACRKLFTSTSCALYSHGIAEAFSTLTGGRTGNRLAPSVAASLLADAFVPRLTVLSLTPSEMLHALRDAENRGVRGGAVYDYLHLVAARKAKATRFYTLNLSPFLALRRHGDPEISEP